MDSLGIFLTQMVISHGTLWSFETCNLLSFRYSWTSSQSKYSQKMMSRICGNRLYREQNNFWKKQTLDLKDDHKMFNDLYEFCHFSFIHFPSQCYFAFSSLLPPSYTSHSSFSPDFFSIQFFPFSAFFSLHFCYLPFFSLLRPSSLLFRCKHGEYELQYHKRYSVVSPKKKRSISQGHIL